jgi:hypothetical protein
MKAATPEPDGRKQVARPASYGSASKNIEDNPMQRNRGAPASTLPPAKTFWHVGQIKRRNYIIARFARPPMVLLIVLSARVQTQNSDN